MIFMSNKVKIQKKVRIGGTIDSDVADWLLKSKGKEKFSTHLNNVLRSIMELEAGRPGKEVSVERFKTTLDNIMNRIKSLQSRVESLESSVVPKKPEEEVKEAEVKRPRGRPKKKAAKARAKPLREISKKEEYNARNDLNWYISHDKYKKIRPDALINAFDLVREKFDTGEETTVGSFKEDYDRSRVGVPYPTFRLFYFPLIRDRMVEKKLVEKVEHAGKKGVYRKASA
ncbi:hypothetical protein CUJ83_10290 [Methanocella sp. CWC-04]|uniref:Uncharacterized protein n=1 Tax=Methanooceanicella nereidis TaxID=2052831 RepID=A0AAP2RDY6_9EURY|nr:hypothetical protein [Methanocella sp. CWC-04]MCD1295387.1 hypothetical protein [Methanocella sp. CWC-04]